MLTFRSLSAHRPQGWRATRARAGQLATRIRLAFAGGRLRRTPSGGGLGGPGPAGGGTGTGYRPLASGRRRSSGPALEEEAASDGAPSLPSRLREVLVAGSFGSSFADVEGASPPASARAPLLGTPSSSGGLTSPRSPADRSPGK